jgi:hypothetical protein
MAIGDEFRVGAVPEFARKRCASDGQEYAAGVAEGKDLAYLVENTCIHCNKLMGKGEVKIMPPSYIQERDPYVNRGVVRKRLMCVSCYNVIRATTRERVRNVRRPGSSLVSRLDNASLFKSAIKMLAGR